jgi:hypothetical protein
MSTTFTIEGTDWEWTEEAQVPSDIMVKHVINVPSIPSRANVPAGRIGPTVTLTGWELRVINDAGTQIHFVPKWRDLTFQKALSAEGTGSVTLELGDAIFDAVGDNDVLAHEFRWEVWWNSKRVFTFTNEDVGEVHVAEDGSRSITMSGRGIAKLLEHGIVLPPGYPTSWPSREWDWIGVTAMEAWLDLYAAVVARFATVGETLPITPTFTDTQDSGSNNWTDDLDMLLEPGDNLLAALQRLTAYATGPDDENDEPEPADWIVQPDGTLEVGAPYGNRLETLVRFQVANDQVAVSRSKTRKDVRNALYVESGDTDIGEAVDAGSMNTWGRREMYVKNGDAPDWVAATEHASRAARISRNEATQITISVLPNTVDRLVFFDYDVGDWVGIDSDDPKITGTYRIVSISVSVDESAGTIVELGCQSLLQVYEARLARAIEMGGGSGSLTAAGSGIPQAPSSPTQIIEAATTSAYAPTLPTPTGLSTTAAANENVSYIDVSWSGPAAGMTAADPISEYEVEVTRTTPAGGQVRYVRVKAGTPAAGSPDPRTTRIEPVEPGATYTITVRSISRLGRISALASTTRLAVGDLTLPDAPGVGGWSANAGLKISSGLRSAVVTWDEHPDPDVKNGNGAYDVQIDTSATFNTAPHPAGDLQGVRVSGTITTFSNLKAFTTYYVRVRAIDSSGNVSAWTTGSVSTTTIRADTVDIGPDAITAPLIRAGEIDTDHIATTGLDAGHIKFGSMDGDRITAHTLNANRIEASAIDVAVDLAVGGVIRTDHAFSPTDHRWISIDGSGVRFTTGASTAYGSGTVTMFFDTATGSITINNATVTGRVNVQNLSTFAGGIDASTATITGGTIQTSSNTSAARVVIDSTGLKAFPSGGGANPNLEFLTSTGLLTLRGAITSSATITGGALITPSAGAANRMELDSAGIRGYNASVKTFEYATATGALDVVGGTITGATFRTSASTSAARVTIDSTGLKAYPSGGGADPNFEFTSSTGLLTLRGDIAAGSATITGAVFRTSSSGRRIQIEVDNNHGHGSGVGNVPEIVLYSGKSGETLPSSIYSIDEGGFAALLLHSPKLSGTLPTLISNPSATPGQTRVLLYDSSDANNGFNVIARGGDLDFYDNFTISTNVGAQNFRMESDQVYVSVRSGNHYWEMIGHSSSSGEFAVITNGTERFRVLDGVTTITGALSVSSSIVGASIGVGGGAVSGGAASFSSVASSGNVSGSAFSTGSTVYANGNIELYGNPPFIDFHGANSGVDFTTRIICWDGEPDPSIEVELRNLGSIWKSRRSGSFHDWRVHALPDIGGTILQRAGGSGQIGPAPPSSRRFKRDITTLEVTDDSPIWRLRPVHYWWDEEKIPGGREWNEAHPGGYTNFIAEEVSEVLPESANPDGEGGVRDVNTNAIVSWLVAAVQHLKEKVADLEGALT